jgi:hypothetical protein
MAHQGKGMHGMSWKENEWLGNARQGKAWK